MKERDIRARTHDLARNNRQKLPEQDPLNQADAKLRRSGLSEEQIAVSQRVDMILALGREQSVAPCNACPRFNKEALCDKRDEMKLDQEGRAICPENRGRITVISIAK